MNTDLKCVRCGRTGHRSSQCRAPMPAKPSPCQRLTTHKSCGLALEHGRGIVWCTAPGQCPEYRARGQK
jgi:hypothetical protein